MSSKHGANSWDDYLNVHQRRIADFTGHFIVDDRVGFRREGREILPAIHVGQSGWPTLGDVIEEAYSGWLETVDADV